MMDSNNLNKSNIVSKRIADEVINFVIQLLQNQEIDKKGKINLEDALNVIQDQNEKDKIYSIIDGLIPIVEKKEKKPREKKLKDENAPKKPKSGYMIYCQNVRTEIKQENPDKKMIEISKILGSTWKELSEEDKKPYMKKASKDKKRYDNEMKDYIRPSDEALLEQKVNQKRSRKSKSSGEQSKLKKTRISSKKDKNAPKNPISSYIYFTMEKRSEVKESNPDMSAREITKELGRMWKEEFADENDRKKWIELAEQDKERYTQEKENWIPNEEESGEQSKRKKMRISSKKDKNAPKNPISSYIYFTMEKRSEVKESNPDMSATEITKELGRMWKEDFSDENDRKKWIKLAKKDKERYTQEKAKFNGQEQPEEQDQDEEVEEQPEDQDEEVEEENEENDD